MRLFVVCVAVGLLLAGCIEMANVKIVVKRYSGDCRSPLTYPCCEGFEQPNFELLVDGQPYRTDQNGMLLLRLERNANHTIRYAGCGRNYSLTVYLGPDYVEYVRTHIQGNGRYTASVVRHRQRVEINIPCCRT